jgi:preflagellin peptidase FlaK
MLLIGSYFDIRSREVADKLWLGFGIAAAASAIWEITFSSVDPLVYGIRVGIASIVALGFYWIGMFGGADAKAVIVVSLFMESSPSVPPIFFPAAGLVILVNALFLTLAIPIVLVLFNLMKVVRGDDIFQGFENEPFLRKVLVMFLGYRLPAKSRSFYFTLERIVDGKRKLSFPLTPADDFVAQGDVWATPGIPFLVLITVGFLVLIFRGDLMLDLLTLIFGFRMPLCC